MKKITIVPSNGEFEVCVDGEVFQLVQTHDDALALRTLIINDGALELKAQE